MCAVNRPNATIPRHRRPWLLGTLLLAAPFVAAAPDAAAQQERVLRYVSLKADKVYLRKGPGTGYPIAKVYERAGLPVEVIREFDVWRQVRDAGGTVGWVHSALLSPKRTALVLPWELKEGAGDNQRPAVAVREHGDEGARAVTQVEVGTLVAILGCEKGWCRISFADQRGYIEQTKLWGAYPGETIR
jgi:SH3-like domain-containing protein